MLARLKLMVIASLLIIAATGIKNEKADLNSIKDLTEQIDSRSSFLCH
jgi:hypothetical protein